jgi:hypothetical protein
VTSCSTHDAQGLEGSGSVLQELVRERFYGLFDHMCRRLEACVRTRDVSLIHVLLYTLCLDYEHCDHTKLLTSELLTLLGVFVVDRSPAVPRGGGSALAWHEWEVVSPAQVKEALHDGVLTKRDVLLYMKVRSALDPLASRVVMCCRVLSV